jgi:hypothetical protein
MLRSGATGSQMGIAYLPTLRPSWLLGKRGVARNINITALGPRQKLYHRGNPADSGRNTGTNCCC